MITTKESKELAERLLGEAIVKPNIDHDQLTTHADRGSSTAAKPVAFLLIDLPISAPPSPTHAAVKETSSLTPTPARYLDSAIDYVEREPRH